MRGEENPGLLRLRVGSAAVKLLLLLVPAAFWSGTFVSVAGLELPEPATVLFKRAAQFLIIGACAALVAAFALSKSRRGAREAELVATEGVQTP